MLPRTDKQIRKAEAQAKWRLKIKSEGGERLIHYKKTIVE
jgi:hypothetical protein